MLKSTFGLVSKILDKIPLSQKERLLRFPLIRYINLKRDITRQKKENEKICTQVLPLYIEEPLPDDKRRIVYVSDEYVFQGGLCDKLRAVISLYAKAIEKGMDFKVHFAHPFQLSDYLVPNMYNWSIGQTLRRTKDAIPFRLAYYVSPYTKSDYGINPERTLDKFLETNKDKREYHVYSNAFWQDKNFGDLFHELFKPSDAIQKQLDLIKKDHTNYISMSFRFLNILGDFKDTWTWKELDPIEKKKYIDDSIDLIKSTYQKHREEVSKVFVASDSITLLNEAQKLDFVFIIPGEVKHTQLPADDYSKVFLDFLIISEAKQVYMCMKEKMFTTSFPYYASLAGKKPFEVLKY